MVISRTIRLAAVAGGLALRVYLALQPPIVTPDSVARYESLAHNLVSGHGFSRRLASPYAPDRFNQPGYPLFLAGVYLAAGEQRLAVVLAQFMLEALTLAAVLEIARRAGLTPLARAVVAALAFLCPVLPMLARAIWSETLATTALTATLLAWLVALRGGGRAPWIFAGAGSAACLLVRPDLIPAIGLLALVAAVLSWRRASMRRLALAGLVFAAALCPWMARNYAQFGKLQPLGSYSDILGGAYISWLDTWVDDVSQLAPYWWYTREPTSPANFPPDKVIDQAERAKAETALAQARMFQSFDADPVPQTFSELAAKARRDRPFRTFVVVPVRRLVSTWSNVAAYAHNFWIRSLWVLFLLCALAGACWGVRHRTDVTLLLLATVVGRSVLPLMFGIGVEPRYVVEALPAIFLFIGFVVQSTEQSLGARAHRKLTGSRDVSPHHPAANALSETPPHGFRHRDPARHTARLALRNLREENRALGALGLPRAVKGKSCELSAVSSRLRSPSPSPSPRGRGKG